MDSQPRFHHNEEKTMQRIHILIALCVGVALAMSMGSAASAESTGFVNQHQIDQSGVKGNLVFLDTEDTGMLVTGVATGLDPGLSYVTLLYDLRSVPSGPSACVPLSAGPMFVEFWTVNADGTGTLDGRIDRALSEVGTASIRIFTGEPPGLLVACGRVHED